MHLEADEISALAEFFARRYPDPADRARLSVEVDDAPLDDVGGDPVAVWTTILDAAQERGVLRPLVAAAAKDHQGDSNLRELLRILSDERPSRRPLIGALVATGVAVGTAAGVLTLVVLGWSGALGSRPEAVAAVVPTTVEDEVVAALTAAPAARPRDAAAAPPTADPELQPQSELAAVARPTETGPITTTAAVVATSRSVAPGSCGAGMAPGQLVGWFYVGSQSPGTRGHTLVLDSAVNVRAEPPTPANHFDLSAPVLCHLDAGDAVRLTADPLFVPRDAWWVPLHAGDVVDTTDGTTLADRG